MARKSRKRATAHEPPPGTDTELRIIGGKFRGSKLRYHGDRSVRPMKHRVREAIFNLITTEVNGRHAIDLFAGTGALGLEALSRGAAGATLIEKHVPTARVVEENIAHLGVDEQCTLLMTSAFLWGKRDLPTWATWPQATGRAWLVFCSPPYDFYVERQAEMLDLVGAVLDHAPAESIIVVEADERFDFALLPGETWDVRAYPPAVVGILRT